MPSWLLKVPVILYRARTPTTKGKFFFWTYTNFPSLVEAKTGCRPIQILTQLTKPDTTLLSWTTVLWSYYRKCHAKFSSKVSDSHDLISNFPCCLQCSSCDISLENFVWDQLKIPSNIFFLLSSLVCLYWYCKEKFCLGKAIPRGMEEVFGLAEGAGPWEGRVEFLCCVCCCLWFLSLMIKLSLDNFFFEYYRKLRRDFFYGLIRFDYHCLHIQN